VGGSDEEYCDDSVRGVLRIGRDIPFGGGVPALQQELASTNVSAKLAKELIIFWVFMGAAMVTFGGILVTCGFANPEGEFTGSAMAQWVAGA
jgi:hypothetical protein